MRLDELVGYKSTPEHTQFKDILSSLTKNQSLNLKRQAFNQWLDNNGFTSLGAGAFAMVFTHPGIDYCIKVFRNDDAYAKFVNYCFSHKAECLPRFRGKIVKIDDRTSAIRVEKLAPLSWRTREQASVLPIVSNYALLPVMSHEEREHWLGAFASVAAWQCDYLRSHLDILDTVDGLKNIREKETYDLTYSNFMLRDGKTLVITDPWL